MLLLGQQLLLRPGRLHLLLLRHPSLRYRTRRSRSACLGHAAQYMKAAVVAVVLQSRQDSHRCSHTEPGEQVLQAMVLLCLWVLHNSSTSSIITISRGPCCHLLVLQETGRVSAD